MLARFLKYKENTRTFSVNNRFMWRDSSIVNASPVLTHVSRVPGQNKSFARNVYRRVAYPAVRNDLLKDWALLLR